MADDESQNTYEPLRLKWVLPIESTEGMITAFKNVIFLLDYVQRRGCSKDTIDKIIENDINPVTNGIRDEYDFFIASTIMALCTTVDDYSDPDELMGLVKEITGKFICMLKLAARQLDSVSDNASEDSLTYEVNTSKLVIGMVIKNYKEMCQLFDEEVKTGEAKKSQLKNWKRYFDWEKDGKRLISGCP